MPSFPPDYLPKFFDRMKIVYGDRKPYERSLSSCYHVNNILGENFSLREKCTLYARGTLLKSV